MGATPIMHHISMTLYIREHDDSTKYIKGKGIAEEYRKRAQIMGGA